MARWSATRFRVVEVVLGPAPSPPTLAARVDVVFTEPGGVSRRVPAFWSRGQWRVRYSSGILGAHDYRADGDLALAAPGGVVDVGPGEIGPGEIGPDMGGQSLHVHGPLRVAADRRHLEHADGTTFLWLADTWWEGFTRRVTTEQFRELGERRSAQGFSVVQIVAGLYPEMAPHAPEGESRSGWPWVAGFADLNPAWFDEADERIELLVEQGLVPCIVGGWGFYLQAMGPDRMLRHWRELIARWGAHPVVWCLAGEVTALELSTMRTAMRRLERGSITPGALVGVLARQVSSRIRRRGPRGFPDTESITAMLGLGPAVAEQVRAWNDVLREVRRLDPFGRPVTVHPQPNWPPYDLVDDPDLVDLWMLQTGHSGIHSLGPSVDQVLGARAQRPPKPVLVGEVDYEGILGSSGPEMQRFLFWSHLLSGAAGHTYGAQGLWGFNTPDYPAGDGGRWGDLTWPEAAALPGAEQLGLGRRLLLELPWETFEAHPEWVEPHQRARDRIQPYAAGRVEGPRVVYFPAAGLVRDSLGFHSVRLTHLGSRPWRGRFVNPRTGAPEAGTVLRPGPDGSAGLEGHDSGPLPSKEDWVLVLESAP